ncbi:MAG: NAD(P)-binding domain-containing protein [Planctomycetes bacterium]|nr:NAD(P)-binding domain-containing protein [Planctomycetota bacterium]
MNIAVWGAGNVGAGLVNRLAVSAIPTRILWINRSLERVDKLAADVKHGLSLTATCPTVIPIEDSRAASRVQESDVVVLTHGEGVPLGGSRSDVYPLNRQMLRERAIPALRGYRGIVVVVTNPVDLITRLVMREASLPPERIMGLGTVVDTARLKAAVAELSWEEKSLRDIKALAIGTHDEYVVPLIDEQGFPRDLRETARMQVVRAAERVKGKKTATMFPIVEGVMWLLASIKNDDLSVWPVSVCDPDCPDGLCYSLPCRIGRQGWRDRDYEIISRSGTQKQIDEALAFMRSVLAQT